MTIQELFGLKGKTAVVTGGTGNLGRSMCEVLAAAGAKVIVTGRNEKKCREEAARLNGLYNTDCCGYKMDISDMKDIKNGMKKAAGKKGRIDILVNNAVYCEMGNPESMTEEEWAYGVDGTLNSAYRCLKAVIPYMGNGSKIVNISSMYGMISPDMRIYREHPDFFSPPNYGAAKAGIIQLTKYFAVYLAAKGIGVNCLTPGSFPSKEVRKSKGFIKELTKKIPIGRVGEPHELGGAVLFLSSGASSYVTGQNIIVDGGWTIW